MISKIFNIKSNIYNRIVLSYRDVKYGNGLKINGQIFLRGKGKLILGNNVRINSSLESNPIGGNTRTTFHISENAKVCIGNNVGISNTAIVSKVAINIGNDVLIGGGCKLYDTDFHPVNPEERLKNCNRGKCKVINIEDNVFIGAHSIILKGVTIGKNSVIAAGSIVTKDVPNNELWGGIPAKFIKIL